MKIHQLTVHYDPSEDRLLLRIGTTDQTEIQAWLTRRLTLKLIPHLPKVLASQLALIESNRTVLAPVLASGSPTESKPNPPTWLDQSDLSGTYRPPVKVLTDGSPLLVTEIDLRPESEGQTVVVLKERRPERTSERTLELKLEPQLLQGLYHLVSESLPRTDWTLGAVPVAMSPSALPTATPPKHLLN